MAEILGAVASGISVAHLATKVVAAGFQFADILKEIQDVPHDIQHRLGQLQTLALSFESLEAAHTSNFLTPALKKARLDCHRCLRDLQAILEQFQHRIKQASSIKRSIVIARILLKGDTISRIEHRLKLSVDVLYLAQQAHLVHLFSSHCKDAKLSILESQRTSELLQSLVSSTSVPSIKTPAPASEHQTGGSSSSRILKTHLELTASQNIVRSRYYLLRLGDERLIGLVDIAVHVSDTEHPHTKGLSNQGDGDKKIDSIARLVIKIKRPRWFPAPLLELSWSFEIRLMQSSSDWKRILRASLIRSEEDVEHAERLEEYAFDGDVQAMTRLLDESTPFHLEDYWDSGYLVRCALMQREWSMANLLLDRGAKPFCCMESTWEGYESDPMREDEHDITALDTWWRPKADGRNLIELQRLIHRDHQNDLLSATLLRHYEGSVSDFDRLRRSIWPDEEYYDPEFSFQRMRVAISLAIGARKTPSHTSKMIRCALDKPAQATSSLDLGISDNSGTTILHSLAEAVGFLQGRVDTAEWHELIRLVLGRAISLDDALQLPARSVGPLYETPFIRLLQGSVALASYGLSSGDEFPLKRRLEHCRDAVFQWLEDLEACGIDLVLYGELERLFLSQEQRGVKRDIRFSFQPTWPHLFIRLVGFTFGPSPRDWHLFWSETTDAFAGEFWELLESEANGVAMEMHKDPLIPGSWPGELSEDDDDD